MSLTFTTAEAVFAKIQTAMTNAGFMQVDRQRGLKIENQEYPGCFINDVMRTRKTICRNLAYVTHFASVVVFSWDNAGTMATTLNGLIETALSTLATDPTWDGLCLDCTIERITTDEGFYDPHCVAIIHIKLEYLSTISSTAPVVTPETITPLANASQRYTAIAALRTALATITSLEDVDYANEEQSVTTYDMADLPLMFVIPVVETYVWEKSMNMLSTLNVNCHLFFLDDGTDEQQGEGLIKAVRDKLGEDITLGGTCAECRIISISNQGTFPLWKVNFSVRIRYEKRIDNV
jgi:hypothetical protein